MQGLLEIVFQNVMYFSRLIKENHIIPCVGWSFFFFIFMVNSEQIEVELCTVWWANTK